MVSELGEAGVQRCSIARHIGTRVVKDATRRRWVAMLRYAALLARRFFGERSQRRLSCSARALRISRPAMLGKVLCVSSTRLSGRCTLPNTCKLRRRAVCGQTRDPVDLRDVRVAAGVDEGKPNFDQFQQEITISKTRWTIVRLQSGALVLPAPVPLRRSAGRR